MEIIDGFSNRKIYTAGSGRNIQYSEKDVCPGKERQFYRADQDIIGHLGVALMDLGKVHLQGHGVDWVGEWRHAGHHSREIAGG